MSSVLHIDCISGGFGWILTARILEVMLSSRKVMVYTGGCVGVWVAVGGGGGVGDKLVSFRQRRSDVEEKPVNDRQRKSRY